jgi:hypothetical protein
VCCCIVVRACEGAREGDWVGQYSQRTWRAGAVWRAALRVLKREALIISRAMDQQISPQLRDFIQVGLLRSLTPIHRLCRSPSPATCVGLQESGVAVVVACLMVRACPTIHNLYTCRFSGTEEHGTTEGGPMIKPLPSIALLTTHAGR